ncbi:MAG: hypothetical protein NTW28_26905 [Candidatus Solibacter sp.]|nr:hypothetical protein [Candidatus Solibacter sp.]
MNSELFEKAGRIRAAFVRGARPEPDEVRFLSEQAQRTPAASTRVKGPATLAATALDPDALTKAGDKQLDAIFRASGTLGIDRIINSGVRQVDPVRHEIYNDAYWKGFLPKGLPLGEMAAQLYTGYFKRFWREGDRYLGETRYLDGRVPLKHTLEETSIERAVNDRV